MQLVLSEEERQELTETLDEAVRDLREEVRKTADHSYRERLKRRQELVREVLDRLAAGE
jgi:nicotinamide riboside kinase